MYLLSLSCARSIFVCKIIFVRVFTCRKIQSPLVLPHTLGWDQGRIAVCVCWQAFWLLHLPCAREWALKATSHVVHHHCEPLNPLAFTGDVKRPMNGNYFNFNILVKYRIKKERNKAGREGDKSAKFLSQTAEFWFLRASDLINLSDLLGAIYTRLKQQPPPYYYCKSILLCQDHLCNRKLFFFLL